MSHQFQLFTPGRRELSGNLVEIDRAPTLESQTRGAPGLMYFSLELQIGDGRVEFQVIKMNSLQLGGDLSCGLKT